MSELSESQIARGVLATDSGFELVKDGLGLVITEIGKPTPAVRVYASGTVPFAPEGLMTLLKTFALGHVQGWRAGRAALRENLADLLDLQRR